MCDNIKHTDSLQMFFTDSGVITSFKLKALTNRGLSARNAFFNRLYDLISPCIWGIKFKLRWMKNSEYPKKSSQWEKFYSQKITITWVHLHLD